MESVLAECRSCRNIFPRDTGFYSKATECKECYKKRVRENRAKNADKYRAYDRARYETNPERKLNSKRTSRAAIESGRHTEYVRQWRERNPEKYKAHCALNNALRDGKITKMPCEICGGTAQAHHEDYTKPLEVRWLCSDHHAKLHKAVKYDR